MREIVYKNLTRNDHKKRDLCIKEIVTRDNMVATIERRCLYFIRDKVYIKDPGNLEELKKLKPRDDAWKKKHFHILRVHNASNDVDKLICKVAGTLYAIVGHYVMCIAFVHSLKIDLTVESIGHK